MERKLSLLRLAVMVSIILAAAYHALGQMTGLRLSLPVDDSPYPMTIGLLVVIASVVALFCQREPG